MAILPKMDPNSPLTKALHLGLVSFGFSGLFSLASNILYLALPIYTMQVYDRVLNGQSQATLILLSVGCLGAFVISGVVDHFRSRVLINFGVVFWSRQPRGVERPAPR